MSVEPQVSSLSQRTEMTLQIVIAWVTAGGIRAQMRSQNNHQIKGDMYLVGGRSEEELPSRQCALKPGELSNYFKELVPWTVPEHPSIKWSKPALTLRPQKIFNDFCTYQNSLRKKTAGRGPNILIISLGCKRRETWWSQSG